MPNRLPPPPQTTKRNSVVDMLAKVPVHKGSLLKSIENLLKTIESSESAVMIPTLLRDKCEFDAWELLFVAKILKASILGHSDLVEFYMNHFGHTASQFAHQSNNQTTNGDQQQQTSLSPSMIQRGQSSPQAASSSSLLAMNDHNHHQNGLPPQQQSMQSPSSAYSSSPAGSVSSMSNGQPRANSLQSTTTSSLATTTSQAQQQVASSSPASSLSGCFSTASSNNAADSPPTLQHLPELVEQPESIRAPIAMSGARQAQPPSLLQLTTTNNHINSVAAGFSTNNKDKDTSISSNIEQLTSQLTAMQMSGCLSAASTSNSVDGALSISTTTANQLLTTTGISNATSGNGCATGTGPTPPVERAHELRSSRSAGCLFRANSGASSPRTPIQTPTTPYPQAETLANGLANGLSGDPSAPVKLLLQIEQLKSSIGHVTHLLESVVELYKKSIDNIALA